LRVGGARTGSPRPRRRAAGAAEAAEAPNLGDQKGGRRRRCGRRFLRRRRCERKSSRKSLASSRQNGVSGDSWPHRQPSPAPRLASSRGGGVLVLFQSVSSALGPGISPFVWLKKKKKKKKNPAPRLALCEKKNKTRPGAKMKRIALSKTRATKISLTKPALEHIRTSLVLCDGFKGGD